MRARRKDQRKTKPPKKAAVWPAILFAIAAVVWTTMMMASLKWRFLDGFVVGSWHGRIGIDFFQIPRGYDNLLLGNSIFCTDVGVYGPYATPYLYHPLVAVAVGPWTEPLAPWTAFRLFVGVSLGLLLLSAWLLSSAQKTPAYRGFAYFALLCSLPTYLMLWNAQAHVLLVVAVALILSGLMRLEQEPQWEQRYCRWIQLGLVIALLSKPVVVLMLPVLFLLPETRRKLLLPLAVYAMVSLLFLLVGGLNPGGYNGIHWLNIIHAGSSPKQILNWLTPGEYDLLRDHGLYSLPIFVDRLAGCAVCSLVFKLPLVAVLVMSLSPLVLAERAQRLRAAIVTVSLCILSHFLCYYPVQEYHYTTLLPVLPVLLWLWQRERVPRLRGLLLTSFVVSLMVFMPTPCFLAPKQPERFQAISLLQRVVPVLVAFLCLTVYGIAFTWLGRRRPRLIPTQIIHQLWPALRLAGAFGILFGGVLAAAYSTVPRRLFSAPAKWTSQDLAEHYEDMITQLQRTVKTNPELAEAHNKLGYALANGGRSDEALAQYRQALELKPDFVEAHCNLGDVFLRLGRFDEAVAQYWKAIELKPDLAEAHNNLGDALVARGQLDAAVVHYRKALESNPDYAVTHYNLGNVLARQGRADEALAQYRQALEIDPDYAAANNNLGIALARRGQFDEAASHFRRAVELQPNNVDFQRNSASLLATCPEAALRNGAAAIEHAQQANQLSGGRRPEVLNTLAAAYAEAGRFPESLTAARKALELATQQDNHALVEVLRARIALYEAGKPYHQTSSASAPPPKP